MRSLLAILFTATLCAQAPVTPTPVEQAWETLTSGLQDKRVDRRAKAIRALGLTLRNERATTETEKALTDPDLEVRVAAALALGEMKSSASIPKLKKALEEDEPEVGVAATQALDMLGDPLALEAYFAILTGEQKTKGNSNMIDKELRRIREPRALAKIGFEQGIGFIPFAGMGYSVYKMVRKGDASPVKAHAAAALARDPDPEVTKALARAVFGNPPLVQAAALSALAKRGDASIVPDILPAIHDDKDEVRFAAAATVIRLSPSTPAAATPSAQAKSTEGKTGQPRAASNTP
jgi:HEAT repeat protein